MFQPKTNTTNGLEPESNASIGQVLKFAAQEELQVKPRNDLTEELRTATLRRNPDLRPSLLSSLREELKQRDNYITITRKIESLTLQIEMTVNGEDRNRYKSKRTAAYRRRAKREKDELKKYHERDATAYKRLLSGAYFQLGDGATVERALRKEHGYSKFCFIPACSEWITSEEEWYAHCEDHIGRRDVPSRSTSSGEVGDVSGSISVAATHLMLRFPVHSTPEPQAGIKRKFSLDGNRGEKL
ncbi:hypothetical protein DL769_009558 [Monosporascus sp. CRB-8-3]|nr:hypothetical protein DL769_009558 [Monosporascus sp. CRB-8-3]